MSPQASSKPARLAAAGIAVLILATLLLRLVLSTAEEGSVLAALWRMSRFFTIWTNVLVMVVMFKIAISARASLLWMTTSTLAIAGVGIVYHLLLAHQWNPQGLVKVADVSLHTVVPLLTVVWWLLYAQAQRIETRLILATLIWPTIYSVVALVRAYFTGVYPYFFMNPTEMGWLQVLLNLLVISLGFFLMGMIMLVINRMPRDV